MKIDYIAASFNLNANMYMHTALARDAKSVISSLAPDEFNLSIENSSNVSRTPYRDGMMWDSGFRLFWGGQDTILIELTGRGCTSVDTLAYLQKLDNMRQGNELLKFNKFTRLDVASDYETGITPYELVSQLGINERIKTRNVLNSKSGQTFYIGSRKSARFCRVYEYTQPHPRAGFTRVEFQINKDAAPSACEALLLKTHSVQDIFLSAWASTFLSGYESLMHNEINLSGYNEPSKAGTTVWVYSQVVPALARLLDEKEITLTDLLKAINERRKK